MIGGTKPIQYLTGAHARLCARANSNSWVSWLIDWLIDQQIKPLNSSRWWKHRPRCSLSVLGLSCRTHRAWGPWFILTGISGARLKGPVHIYAACGYLRSHASVTQLMGALALPDKKRCAKESVVMLMETGLTHHRIDCWAYPLCCRFFWLSLWEIMCHCYANTMPCLCKGRFGSLCIFFTLSTALYMVQHTTLYCCGGETQQ